MSHGTRSYECMRIGDVEQPQPFEWWNDQHTWICEHCVLGKQKKVSFNTDKHRTGGLLDYIYSDLWGLSKLTLKGEKRYFLTFIDDFYWKIWVCFLKTKDDAFEAFKEWKILVENQMERKIKYLHTDNGLEFCSEEVIGFCKVHGITRHKTVRHTP